MLPSTSKHPTHSFFSHNEQCEPASAHLIQYQASSDLKKIDNILKTVQPESACIYWYFGSHGLKQGGVDFYKPVLSKTLAQNATPFLVDLSPWGAFKAKGGGKLIGYSKKGESLHGERVKVLQCRTFFAALQQVTSNSVEYPLLVDITTRKNLRQPSQAFNDTGKTLGSIFKDPCPVLDNLYELDCAKTYSILQYIEFLYLIDMVLQEKPGTSTIHFILPNDEAKYYVSSMEADIKSFLEARGHLPEDLLTITVDCFSYGEELHHRPYNAPSSFVRKQLVEEDIIGDTPASSTRPSC